MLHKSSNSSNYSTRCGTEQFTIECRKNKMKVQCNLAREYDPLLNLVNADTNGRTCRGSVRIKRALRKTPRTRLSIQRLAGLLQHLYGNSDTVTITVTSSN